MAGRTVSPDAPDVTLSDVSLRPAGAALNCALSAAGAGAEVQIIGLLGNDPFAELITRRLTAANIGTAHLKTVHGPTGTVISLAGAAGQTRFYSYRGVNAQPYGPLPPALIQPNDWLYLAGYSFQDAESRSTAEILLTAGAHCALDPPKKSPGNALRGGLANSCSVMTKHGLAARLATSSRVISPGFTRRRFSRSTCFYPICKKHAL